MADDPSVFVLGAAAFGQPYGSGADRAAPGDEVVGSLLRAAAERGIRMVDTARAYGESEAVLGRARAAGGLGMLGIVTKVRPLDALDPAAAAVDVAAAVRRSVHESLEALAADRVDVMLLHRARDAERGAGAAPRALAELVEDGVVGRWGISVTGAAELVRAVSYPGMRYVQVPFNLLDRRWLSPAVQQALSARPEVHVTVRSALLQGLLASTDGRPWPAAGVDGPATLTRLDRLVAELGRRDRLDLCLAYVRGHAWVDDVVLGCRRLGQLGQLADALERPSLTADEIAAVHAAVAPGPLNLVDPSRWTRSSP